jgi:hypothetical protein
MDDECKEVTGKPISLKQVSLKMLQGSVSSQRLVSSVKTDQEARDLIELLSNELESMCWKEFHRNQQLRQSKREKEKKLSEKTKQTQDFIQEIAVSEDKLLREIEIIQSKKVGQQTCDHSIMSEHEEETNQLLIAEDRTVISILNTKKPTRTLPNKTFSLKNLDKMVNETECTLTTTKEISQELKRKELCQGLSLTTLQSKLDNLTRLEEIYAIQFQKLKNEMDKANFYLSRKKRNLQVIKEHIHEVQVVIHITPEQHYNAPDTNRSEKYPSLSRL